MSLLKFKKTDNLGDDQDWIALYAEAIRNRLRIDLNLSDVNDKAKARHNLELDGDNNHTHFHDDRYVKISEANSKFDDLDKPLKFTITGKATSETVTLKRGQNVQVNILSVDSDNSNVTKVGNGERYIVMADSSGKQILHIADNFSIDVQNKKLKVANIKCKGTIECAGDITGNIITGTKVYNAVWSDYAELMPRGEETEPGDIIMLDLKAKDERYIKATDKLGTVVAGVHSNEFGMLIGGEDPVDGKDLLEYNIDRYIPVALSGRVHVNFIGKAKKGAKVVPSSEPGYGRLYNKGVDDPDTIIGYLVEDDDKTDKRKLKIRITR